jgi:hypothetical protein
MRGHYSWALDRPSRRGLASRASGAALNDRSRQAAPAARALALWGVFFVVYAASAGTRLVNLQGQGHYVTLARWFLEGRVSSAVAPPGEDIVEHAGRYYIAFPPLPAVLMLPLVAASPRLANPVLFTAAFGAANVVLVAALLRRGLPRLGLVVEQRRAAWLVVAFALGTPHWYSAAAGTVWHTSQVCGLTFLLLAALEALGRGRPALCGLLLGLAAAARPPLAFALPFFAPLLARGTRRTAAALEFVAGVAPCALALLLYNFARFGSLADFGYLRMSVGPVLQPFLERGLFHPAHVPRNAFYALLHLPRPSAQFPFLALDPMGNSLLFASPFLVGMLLRRPAGVWGWAAAAAAAAVLGVDFAYFSSGYAQFGYRYVLDAMPFLLLLAAAGYAGRSVALLAGLVLLSVLVNLLGMLWILNWPRMWLQLTAW